MGGTMRGKASTTGRPTNQLPDRYGEVQNCLQASENDMGEKKEKEEEEEMPRDGIGKAIRFYSEI